MARKFYAASSYYGTNVTYDSGGWAVHVFDSKQERDAWVDADPMETPHRETATATTADKISPLKFGYTDNRIYHDKNGQMWFDNGSGYQEKLR